MLALWIVLACLVTPIVVALVAVALGLFDGVAHASRHPAKACRT